MDSYNAHVLRYARVEKQLAIEAPCVGNPAALAEIRDKSENAMARVAAIARAIAPTARVRGTD